MGSSGPVHAGHIPLHQRNAMSLQSPLLPTWGRKEENETGGVNEYAAQWQKTNKVVYALLNLEWKCVDFWGKSSWGMPHKMLKGK